MVAAPQDGPVHPAALPDDALLGACDEIRRRGSGPGGQHRNKVETLVSLTHRATGVRGEAGERRSQAQNRSVALRRLRLALAVGVRAPWAGPSELWRGRCRGGRIACSERHPDRPALLAEALDALATTDWVPRDAAAELGCSATQLVRFVATHAPALVELNRRRAALGLGRLR